MVRRLFVASLGNPAPYHYSRHSAGHVLLEGLRALSLTSPALQSCPAPYTLFRSPALMNVSGPSVARAYSRFLKDLDAEDRRLARLVILHDELELPPGKLKLRRGGSARGHNGLKSVKTSLGGSDDFIKIGVGVGRPESRDPDDVARYVLRNMTTAEKGKVSGLAVEVERLLRGVAEEP